MMLDPDHIIRYDRSPAELEELALFCIAVAGKNADTVSRTLTGFLRPAGALSPFAYVRALDQNGTLLAEIKRARFGSYTRLAQSFRELASTYRNGDELALADRDSLCQITGIGLKTASCWLAWTRPNQRVAMLDVHLLRFLRNTYPAAHIPAVTPGSRKKYLELEDLYLRACGEHDPAHFDLAIWRAQRKQSSTKAKTK